MTLEYIRKGLIRRTLLAMPLRNTIMFESVPNLSDNTKAVFDEMIRRNMNQKYKLIWVLNKEEPNLPQIDNVEYILKTDKKFEFYRYTSKCFVCCNEYLGSLKKGQTSVYLTHGTPMKSLRAYYTIPENIDYCISAGENIIPIYEHEFNYDQKNIVPLGFPRNDVLTNSKRDLHPLFKNKDFDKIIVWYPTYRQHSNGTSYTGNALPIINDVQKAEVLNEVAVKNRTLIVLKPHFAQDLSYIKNLNLSNILFINDSFFVENEISSYEFVGNCDALITDYSSIYFDYTLCDKPIALVWEDYEEYKKSPGFATGIEQYLSGGEKVYTLDEFTSFIERVAKDEDILKEERNRVCAMTNYSKDGKNAARVVDFIVEKAKL